MIVYYNDHSIEAKLNYIKYQDYIIDVDNIVATKIIDFLLSECGLDSLAEVSIDFKPCEYTKAESLLLMAVGVNHYYVYSKQDNKKYEITFAYNFPFILEKELYSAFFENINEIAKAQLITLGELNDFIRVDVSNIEKFCEFKNRVGNIVRRNDKIFDISYNYNLDTVLNNWQKYCDRKFNKFYPQFVLDIYKKIYSQPGFSTVTYLYNNEIVAQGVIFVSEYTKTIYYCIFEWQEKFKSKSPGIYAYCKTIYRCFEEGYMFSFCYGSQKYKYDLIREFLCCKK